MRLSLFTAYLALAVNTAHTASIPEAQSLDARNPEIAHAPRVDTILTPENALEKRKGGGGKGGGGGGSSGGGKSGGGGSSSGRTSSTSNTGGATSAGSGPARSFGGGQYYGGGAAQPYKSGSRTPKGLLAGTALGVAGAALIFPGIWLYSVYPYYYSNPYRFYNRSANATNNNSKRQSSNGQGANQTLPVVCLCEDFAVCGCDENTDQSYLDQLVGNGSYAALNKSLVTVSDKVNGSTTALVINGTLPNGTTAPGGTDDAGVALSVSQYWIMGLLAFYAIAFL